MSPHVLSRPALQTLARLAAVLGLLVALSAGLLASAPGASAAVPGTSVMAEAAKHRGKPYLYGAVGPARFDCSGYVRYVYARMGKKLPRTSRQQYAATRRVAKSDKRVGDLIFTRSRSGRIGHVGIYAGGGRMWASPKSGDVVKLQRIWSSNYAVGRL